MNEDTKKLVIARIDNLPRGIKIAIGGEGSFTKAELMKNVEEETPIGKDIVELHLAYIKSFFNK